MLFCQAAAGRQHLPSAFTCCDVIQWWRRHHWGGRLEAYTYRCAADVALLSTRLRCTLNPGSLAAIHVADGGVFRIWQGEHAKRRVHRGGRVKQWSKYEWRGERTLLLHSLPLCLPSSLSCLPCSFSPFPFLLLPLGHLNAAIDVWELGKRYKLPQRGLGQSISVNRIVFSVFGP